MKFLSNLPKLFINSAVRQVGRDGGKVVSNKIYKGKHSTPVYRTGNPYNLSTDSNEEFPDIFDSDLNIQPPIKKGGIGVVLKGFLIQIIPFIGSISVLIRGISYLFTNTAKVYDIVANKVPDRRYKEGYRIEGATYVKTEDKRYLNEFEIKRIRGRGISYILSFFLFIFIGWLIYGSNTTDTKISNKAQSVAETYWYMTTNKGVNVRLEPSMNSDIIFTLSSTDSVLVIEKDGPKEIISGQESTWFKITHNNQEGWIWSGLLKKR